MYVDVAQGHRRGAMLGEPKCRCLPDTFHVDLFSASSRDTDDYGKDGKGEHTHPTLHQ